MFSLKSLKKTFYSTCHLCWLITRVGIAGRLFLSRSALLWLSGSPLLLLYCSINGLSRLSRIPLAIWLIKFQETYNLHQLVIPVFTSLIRFITFSYETLDDRTSKHQKHRKQKCWNLWKEKNNWDLVKDFLLFKYFWSVRATLNEALTTAQSANRNATTQQQLQQS